MKKISEIQEDINRLARNSASEKPVIAAFGLMNTGKSYLLNMLTEHVEQEYFKTADRRETSANKTFESQKYIYLDTPGLDANDQDDVVAKKGIIDADIILFVHQPQGELESIEIDFLKNLKEDFGKSAKNNIVIVISKIDKEASEKIEEIEAAIRKQCVEILNTSFEIFQVSNTFYKTGVHEKEQDIIEASNIHALARHIEKISPEILYARKGKRDASIEKISIELETLLQNFLNERELIEKELCNEFKDFNQQINQLESFLTESNRKFNQI